MARLNCTTRMAALRQSTSESFIVVEVENKAPSGVQATNRTVTQSFEVGRSIPVPVLRTFMANPEAVDAKTWPIRIDD